MLERLIVERQWLPAELEKHWAAGETAWAEGEILNFVYQGAAQQVDLIAGGVSLPMQLLDGTDFWTLALGLPDLPKLVLSYWFQADGSFVEVPGAVPYNVWRGEGASPVPSSIPVARERFFEPSIESQFLNQTRTLTVYLPPMPHQAPLPVIYLADGQSVTTYADYVEPLIAAGDVPPLILVGLNTLPPVQPFSLATDRRSQEYLPTVEPDIFDAHARFFTEEVMLWVQRELGATTEQKQRAVFGTSSGAAFAVAMGRLFPALFGNIIAFSLGWNRELKADWQECLPPRYYLMAGKLEGTFCTTTAKWAQMLAEARANYVYRELVCGHDNQVWHEEFPKAVQWFFANDREKR